MSLIPYQPREGREIVLRHRNAIVVRDTTSHRLEIRGLTECPTCHQPLPRPGSPDRPYDRTFETNPDSYVDPNYFRMLRAGQYSSIADQPATSPVRRLFQPSLANSPGARSDASEEDGGEPAVVNNDAEFVSSTPGVPQAEGSRIRKEAFSQNHFKTFFVEEKVLGKGGKGVVLLVRHELDGCHLGHFACKRVPVGDDHAWLEKVLIEVELLAKLSHPNLVSYRHVWLENVRLTRFGPSVACAFILQQYCNGGDLHQYMLGGAPREATKEELKAQMRRRSKGQAERPQNPLLSGKQLSFEEIYSLFRDITSGVAYLHANGYIHRDLKPSNCLLHREGAKLTCLISDFGEVQAENVVRKSTGSTGTISYCAPEVLKTDATGHFGNFTTKSDIFSLGMILYFMCFGRLPYRSANALQEELEDMEELRAEIKTWQGFQEERRERPDLPSKLYTLLRQLLSLSPSERPGANDVLAAMRSEANFDGMARDPGLSPTRGLRGARVQNLDSPAGPSTPVPDPRKPPARNRTVTRDELGSWNRSPSRDTPPLGENENAVQRTSRTHDQAMTLSLSQEGYRESVSPTRRSEAREETHFSPPLLLPPPRSRTSEMQQWLSLSLFRLSSTLGLEQEMLSYLLRLSVFLVKIATLARPCFPYMASPEVSIPLVLVAALDFGLPAHTSTSFGARRAAGGRSTIWGPGTSVLLITLHFTALWVARHWGALCAAAPRDVWADWQAPVDTYYDELNL